MRPDKEVVFSPQCQGSDCIFNQIVTPIFFGNTLEIKVQEKIMIYGHFLATGSLPPGNRFFR